MRGNGIPCGQGADDATSQVTADDIMGKSHKMIAQINHTNQLYQTITQGKMTSCPRMEMIQGSLLMLWMDKNASQHSIEKLLMKENLQLLGGTTTKLARTASTWGIEMGALNR